jgi:hypothetical protein
LHGPSNDRLVNPAVVVVGLLQQPVRRCKPCDRLRLAQDRIGQQVAAQRGLAKASAFSATGEDIVTPRLCQYLHLRAMWPRKDKFNVAHSSTTRYTL